MPVADRSFFEKAIHGGSLEKAFEGLDADLEEVIRLFQIAVQLDMHSMMSEVHDGVQYLKQVKLEV